MKKVLLIVGLVVILTGVFMIKFFTASDVPSVTSRACTDNDSTGCSRSCQQDADCTGTCGCGAININETCYSNTLCVAGPGLAVCKKHQCSFKLEFAEHTGVELSWWERALPNFGLWFSEVKNYFYELRIKVCTKETDTGDDVIRKVPCF